MLYKSIYYLSFGYYSRLNNNVIKDTSTSSLLEPKNIVLCGKKCNEVKVPEKTELFSIILVSLTCHDMYPYQRDTHKRAHTHHRR